MFKNMSMWVKQGINGPNQVKKSNFSLFKKIGKHRKHRGNTWEIQGGKGETKWTYSGNTVEIQRKFRQNTE